MARRKPPATNFAELAVRQVLELDKVPERIIDIVTRNIPPHSSAKFAGLDEEIRAARAWATRYIKDEADTAEREINSHYSEISSLERRRMELDECTLQRAS